MVFLQNLNEGMNNCESVELVCSICHGELTLEKPYRSLGRIRTGNLRCKDGCAVYPIIYGVPIMLLPGQPADWSNFNKWPWRSSISKNKERMIGSVTTGEFDKEMKISGASVTEKQLRKVRRMMSKTRWQKHLHEEKTVIVAEGDRTSSEASNVVSIAERLRQIERGVIMDIGCGGGFTTERVLQEIQPSVCSMSVDIDLGCVKAAGKRAELLGMSDRNIEICADARHLPFVDESLSVAYTRNGFNHIRGYVDALSEVYRALKKPGAFVVAEAKFSLWLRELERLGLNHEEQVEVLHHLGCFTDAREFVENVEKVGFNILEVEDVDSSYQLVDAVKD